MGPPLLVTSLTSFMLPSVGQRDSYHHYAKSDQTPNAYLNRALEL